VQIEDGAFQHMPYLQQLWLNHNRLTHLPVGLPPSVRRLLVESNSIRAVTQDAFPATGCQLVALSLAGNHISTLRRGDLRRLPLLRALDLSVNNIRRLHADALSDNARMRSLQLSRNPLSHLLTGCFSGLAALRRLSLSFVPSDKVDVEPEVFDDLPALMALDLDSSPGIARSVMESDSLLSSLSGVKELGLLNTQMTGLPNIYRGRRAVPLQMTGLPSDLPRYFPSLVVVRLSSSRWHCDAPAAAWLRAWMASTGIEVVGAGEILCLTPPDVRGRSLLTIADWELDGELPTAPIVYRVLTTVRPGLRHPTTEHGRSPLDWPRRQPRPDFDEYVDRLDVEFRSAVYDDDDAPDVLYDVVDNRSRVDVHDVSELSPDGARSSSTSASIGSTELEVPVHLKRLRLASTTARTATATSTTTARHDVATETTTQRPTSSDGRPNYVVLLTTLTILATLVIIVVVVVAIAMMTRSKATRRTDRQTSIELQRLPSSNGSVKQNGRAVDGRGGPRKAASENGLIGWKDGEAGRRRLPLVAFIDNQTSSGVDDVATTGAPDASCCSVEALSLIPGRDINHEGPQRVYKWADF